jgi:hypothetical protein
MRHSPICTVHRMSSDIGMYGVTRNRMILCQDFGRENIVYFQGCILWIFSTDFVSPMRPVEISEPHHD